MKVFAKKLPFFLCIFVNVVFICLHICQYTSYTQLSYLKQQKERTRQELQQQCTSLKQHISEEQSATKITHFARNVLHMKPTRLSQIHKIDQ